MYVESLWIKITLVQAGGQTKFRLSSDEDSGWMAATVCSILTALAISYYY